MPDDPNPDDPPQDPPDDPQDPPDDADTFPREYVEKLRKEAGDNRVAAKEATDALEPLQQRLFGLLVEKTGRLADPTDLPFDAALVDDEDGLTAAIDALLERKPHLASRRVGGDVGQGEGEGKRGEVNLGGMLRASA